MVGASFFCGLSPRLDTPAFGFLQPWALLSWKMGDGRKAGREGYSVDTVTRHDFMLEQTGRDKFII